MMQLSWIGRQVFAKFFRKNGLLGHPQQSTKPSTPSPGGGGLSSQGQSVGLCEAVQVQLLQSTGSTGGAKVESTKPVGVCPPSHHHRHRFPSQEDRWSTIPPVDSGPLCSLNIPESSGISSRIMSVSLAYPRTLQQNPWRSASSAGLSHVTRDCCSNAYSSGSWTASRRKFHTSNVLDINEINADSSVTEKVTIVEMKRFLRKQELPFVDGFTCLRLDCFLCKKASRKKKTFPWETDKLFVNKTTGYFVCIHCKISGSWRNFQDLVALSKSSHGLNKNAIELLKKDDLSSKYEDKLNDLQMNSREVCTLTDEEWGQIAMKFGIDKLKKSVLEQYEMRYSVDSQQLLLPIYNIELNRVGYSVLSLSPKSGEIETHTVPKSCKESFGWKQIFQSFSSSSAAAAKSKSVVLVQSPLDVLAIASSTSYLPLALHTGCTYLPQEFLPKLEHFDEILLWFGNDVKSWETAKSFGRKLEERRCRLIRPIDLHPAPFVALQQQELNLSKILSGAQIMEHKAITTFSKLREEVFSELSHQDKVAGVKWSRYPYLTKLLKGHRRGELTILTGSTGSGKTTFMSEYSLDLCVQGVNTLWGSFEIRNVRLAKTMLTQYSEIDLEKHINEYDKWADKFEKLPLYFMTFHGQQSIKAVLDAMTHSAYVYDIGHVIVDNLQFMLGVSDEKGSHIDRFWRQDLIVAAFRKFATLNNCHVTLVMHPRKEGNDTELSNSSIFGGAKASQEADNILILQDRRLTSPKGKKYLQVSKNRFSGDLGMFTLEFNRECLSFATKKKPKIEQSVLLKSKSTHSETKANTSDTSTEDTFNIESSVQNKT